MALFGRQVSLQYGQPGEEGVQLDKLRIGFNVKHTDSGASPKASISVWGLSPLSVGELQKPGVIVRLSAGYESPQVIFEGAPIRKGIRVERRGPERVLSIEAKGGGRQTQKARVELTWSTETTLRQVVERVASEMGVPLGVLQLPDGVVFAGGLTVSGPASELLDRVADMAGASWMVRDGELVFMTLGGSSGDSRVVLSAENGNLIGPPTLKEGGLVEFLALMETSLRPGKLFVARSEDYRGTYVAKEVVFTGDSGYSQEYYTRVVGRERAA